MNRLVLGSDCRVVIEVARDEHVYEILPKLRPREQRLVAGLADPAAAVIDEVRSSSEAYSVLIDGAVACLFGIHARTILADAAYLWMLTSCTMAEHPVVVGRHSVWMCRSLLSYFGTIEGVVAVDNPVSMRWLEWLGASFEPSSAGPEWLGFKLRNVTKPRRAA